MQAIGQIQIRDYNDAVSLTGYSQASRPIMQVISLTGADNTVTYEATTTWKDGSNTTPRNASPSTWAPWTSQQYLYAKLFKPGSLTDLLALAQSGANIDSVRWDIGANYYTLNKAISRWSKNGSELASGGQYATDGIYFFQTVAPYGVIIVDNVMTNVAPSLSIKFSFTFTDVGTGLSLPVEVPIQASAVVNGKGAFFAAIDIPLGATIQNGSPSYITLQAKMYKNGSLDNTSAGTATWSVYVPGTGWVTVSNVAGQTVISNVNGITGGQLNLYDVAVIGYENYKVDIVADGVTYTAFQLVADITDPLICRPIATVLEFRNGVGSSTMTAKVFASTAEVDSAGTVYNYFWEAFDNSGVATYFRSNPIFQTTTTASSVVGATSISLTAVGSNRQGILSGSKIIIDPGTGTEEITIVPSISSLVASVPALTYAHASGAVVVVVDQVAGSSTVASGSSGLTLNVASGTPFVAGAGEAGDIIIVGSGDTQDFRRVVSKATNTLTLDKALTPVNYTVGTAVARANKFRQGKSLTVNGSDVYVQSNFNCYVG